jgi:DNA invertase Pin-like site-specific DNA recombinase
MRVIGYARVSGHDQAERGGGLAVQEAAIRDLCQRQGWSLAGVVRDAGVSGARADRPGLAQVEAAIYGHQVDGVVVHRLDRLARMLLLQERLLADWTAHGVKVVSVLEPDLADDSDERVLLRQIMGAISEFDKARTVARLRGGREAKARRGGFVGGRVALGYRVERRRLVIDFEQAKAVKRAAALRRQGMGYQKIANTLQAEGFPTKRGGTWAANTIRRLLRSPQVRGRISYGGGQAKGEQPALVRGVR